MDENTKSNLVIMGGKPIMKYVVACLTLFNDGNETVRIRARGRHINQAVDTVHLIRRVFIKDLVIRKTRISTDDLIRDDGNPAKVSVIEILIASN